MIGKLMQADFTKVMLNRISDTPPGFWLFGMYGNYQDSAGGCFLQIAFAGYTQMALEYNDATRWIAFKYNKNYEGRPADWKIMCLTKRYDRMCGRCGLDVVVRMLHNRARRILALRTLGAHVVSDTVSTLKLEAPRYTPSKQQNVYGVGIVEYIGMGIFWAPSAGAGKSPRKYTVDQEKWYEATYTA